MRAPGGREEYLHPFDDGTHLSELLLQRRAAVAGLQTFTPFGREKIELRAFQNGGSFLHVFFNSLSRRNEVGQCFGDVILSDFIAISDESKTPGGEDDAFNVGTAECLVTFTERQRTGIEPDSVLPSHHAEHFTNFVLHCADKTTEYEPPPGPVVSGRSAADPGGR